MTHNTPLSADELKSELRRLLAIHILATEQTKRLGLGAPEEVILSGFIKVIEAYRKKHELQAKIDALEYAKISPKFKVEERIEALKQELEKL